MSHDAFHPTCACGEQSYSCIGPSIAVSMGHEGSTSGKDTFLKDHITSASPRCGSRKVSECALVTSIPQHTVPRLRRQQVNWYTRYRESLRYFYETSHKAWSTLGLYKKTLGIATNNSLAIKPGVVCAILLNYATHRQHVGRISERVQTSRLPTHFSAEDPDRLLPSSQRLVTAATAIKSMWKPRNHTMHTTHPARVLAYLVCERPLF